MVQNCKLLNKQFGSYLLFLFSAASGAGVRHGVQAHGGGTSAHSVPGYILRAALGRIFARSVLLGMELSLAS